MYFESKKVGTYKPSRMFKSPGKIQNSLACTPCLYKWSLLTLEPELAVVSYTLTCQVAKILCYPIYFSYQYENAFYIDHCDGLYIPKKIV